MIASNGVFGDSRVDRPHPVFGGPPPLVSDSIWSPWLARGLSSHRDAGNDQPVMRERSDADVASAVAAGDRSALEYAYNKYGGAVRSLAIRVVRNEALAEDVVQETYLSYWRSAGSYRPGSGSLRNFLLTIAHRRAVDMVRSEEARKRREQAPPDRDHRSLEEQVISLTTSESVRRALLDLKHDERTAITMAYLGGFTYVEVAERLGEPEGTIKSRIRSGMKKLASALEEVSS